ncbi:MAG TPA: acyltransferase [Rhizomicrobium sp.]
MSPQTIDDAAPRLEVTRGAAAHTQHHVPALDGVRGIAIILVLLYHFVTSLEVLGLSSPYLILFHFGWCGVDVFFTLSGFLITGILLDTKNAPHYFKSFYVRRILRIFPLYYLTIFAVLLLRTALPQAGVWGIYDTPWAPGSLWWPTLLLQNVANIRHGVDPTGVLTHYWSLAVEEHFYLVWPLLVWLLPRRWILAVALTAAFSSLAIRALLFHHVTDIFTIFDLTPLRMDGLAIGAIAAVELRARGAAALARPALLLLITTMAMLAILFLLRRTPLQNDHAVWLFCYPLVAVCTAAILLLGSAGGRIARMLSAAPLRWFGKYSYGLYVWHPVIGMLLFHSRVAVFPEGGGTALYLAIAAAILILDLTVAWVSFHLWEKRFLDLKRYFPAATHQTKPFWKTAARPVEDVSS